MLVTRSLGPADKGKYSLILSSVAVLMQLSTFGIHTSNTYFVSRDRKILNKIFTNSLFWLFATCSITGSLFLIVNWLYPGSIAMFENGLMIYVVVGCYISLANIIFQNLNIAIDNVRNVNRYSVLAKSITLVLVSSLYLMGRLKLHAAILIALFEFLVISMLCIRLVVKRLDIIDWSIDRSVLRESLRYGFRAYIITLMSFLVVRSDIFLVKYFLSNESAGYYSSAVQITDQIQFFGVVVASLLMPKLSAEKDPWERFRLNKRSFNHLLVIMTLGCLAAFVLAKYLVLLLFGGEFLPTILPFRVLLPAIFFLALETSLAQYLASIGLPMKLAWAWIITFAINVGLNFYLIPEYGEVGAAISSVVSYCFIFVYVLYLVNTHGRKIRKGLV
jgi:O-antigen/teichoic acid export membrane protein